MRGLVVALFVMSVACKKEPAEPPPSPFAGSATQRKPEQIAPPFDIKAPPADVTTTASGLKYKKIITNDTGAAPGRNDTVLVTYTGWKQSTGDTFFTNHSGKPMPLPLANAAPGFTEAMQLLKKGEKAMLWVPPAIGYLGPPTGKGETLVYEVEVIDIIAAPPVPADVAAPPATAQKLKSGIPYVVIRPGTGADKARYFDTITYNYTAWDANGRMFDSTEVKKKPNTLQPFHASKPIEEVLGQMTAGERTRMWVAQEAMFAGTRAAPGMPTKGQLCYEVEVLQISKNPEPPPPPSDVAKPPADTKKTAKGVFYRVLKTGAGGPHPAPTEKVKVNYTGWTTDGRMFDTSTTKGQPVEFGLNGVIAGWTDGLQLMSAGDKYLFWIPEELAYKGAPNKPQGMLVFEIEMISITAAPAKTDAPEPPGHGPPHKHHGPVGAPPTPPP